MLRRATVLAISCMTALPLCGCGGGTPGFGTMSSELRAPGVRSPALARRPAARSLWEVERLRRAPLATQPLADRQEPAGEVRLTVREVLFNSEVAPGSAEKLFGYLALPTPKTGEAAPARLPAVVLVHDLGETASEEAARTWAARGYVTLALDLPGKGPGRGKSRSTGPDMTEDAIFKVGGGARDSFLYRGVSAVVRGISLLRDQKEVEPSKIALLGESWGGVTAALAGTVDDRVNAVVALYGAGGLQRGTPAAAKLKAMSPKERDTWSKAFDVLNYTRSDQPAALFAGGTNDKQWTSESLVETFRRYTGAHWLALSPGKEHDLDAPTRAAIGSWLDHVLKNGPPPLVAAGVTLEDGQWVAHTSDHLPARAVSFFYAPGTGDWSAREWKEVKATRADDRRWAAPAPTGAETTALLIRIQDASGAALTTEAVLPSAKRAAERPRSAGGG